LNEIEAFIPEGYVHVVAAIIWQPGSGDKILISKRQKGRHLADFWELPGGKVEAGESRLQALNRELSEEIDIIPVKASAFKQVRHNYKDHNILLDVWQVTSFKGQVQALEGQKVLWVGIDELAKFRFPEADLPILAAITNNVKVKTEHPL
jgi:8-oxo-dGTP diphosphatase